MSSPRLESFCCTPNDSYRALHHHVPDFRSVPYNVICIVSSCISVVGVVYQLLPRRPASGRAAKQADQNRKHLEILMWLAVADLLASLGILVRSVVWLSGKIPQYDPLIGSAADFGHIFCAVISAWIQFFYLCTYFWTLCYAVDTFLFVDDKLSDSNWPYKMYHLISWGVSAVLCAGGLMFLYFPDLLRCHQSSSSTIPHYLFAYIPILMVMIVNPLLYIKTSQKLKTKLSGQVARFTDKERSFLRAVKTKFLLVSIVFYLCWTPNIVNGIMLWSYKIVKRDAFLALWSFMAVVNPLQALLNNVVYRGVAGCNFRFPHKKSPRPVSRGTLRRQPSENTALLDSFQALT